MTVLLATFAYCVVSAAVPVVNAEAYVGAVGALHTTTAWALAVAAAAGQMVGKLAYYYLGRGSVSWRWLQAKLSSEKWRTRLDTWSQRVGEHLWLAVLLLAVSAVTGIPPFAILSVLAGQLRVSVVAFFVTGLVGRFARFALLLGLVDVLTR